MASDGQSALVVALRMALGEGLEEVRTLDDLTAPRLFAVATRALDAIEGGDRSATKLPAGAAAKHRACAALAARAKEVGFGGALGADELMYPAEATTREFVAWLVEALPRDDGGGAAAEGVRRRLDEAVRAWMGRRWRLPPTRDAASEWRFETRPLDDAPGAEPFEDQVEEKYLRPSVHEHEALQAIKRRRYEADLEADDGEGASPSNAGWASGSGTGATDLGWEHRAGLPNLKELLGALGGGSGGERLGRLAHAAEFAHGDPEAVAITPEEKKEDPDAAAAAAKAEEEAAIEKLRRELRALKERHAAAVSLESEQAAEVARAKAAEAQLRETLEKRKEAAEKAERDYKIKRRTLEMLPDAKKHVADLEELCRQGAAKLAELQREWEAHRAPLEEEVRLKGGAQRRDREKARRLVDEMKRRRGDAARLVADAKAADERDAANEARLKELPQNLNRALYVKRIMEIVRKIDAQRAALRDVVESIKATQRESNKVSATLQRSEALADEHVYQAANAANGKDPEMVRAYRDLADVRKLFETTASIIDETGARQREARDYESKAKQLAARVSTANLERVRKDLASVREENAALAGEVKRLLGR